MYCKLLLNLIYRQYVAFFVEEVVMEWIFSRNRLHYFHRTLFVKLQGI